MKRIAYTLLALLLAALPAGAQINLPSISGAVAALNAIATGTTGAVTATLPGAPGDTTYLCGLDVSAAGGTATVSPITVTGLLGGTFTYQGVNAGGVPYTHAYWPCIPASAINTSISVTTTADGTATAVNVQVWGFRQ
jgi:hypothetical protein